MPADFALQFDPHHRVLLVTFAAGTTDETVTQAFGAMERFIAAHGPCRIVRDYSSSEGAPSPGFVQRMATWPPLLPPGWPQVVIVARPVQFGVMRQFLSLRDSQDTAEYRLVRSRAEAWAALDIKGEPEFSPVEI